MRVAERRVRVVAGATSLIILGWVIFALLKVSVAVIRGLPSAAIYFVFLAWAVVISLALARRSWGFPIGRRLGGVWDHLQFWALLGVMGAGGNDRQRALIHLGVMVASLLIGSWGERSDSAAVQPETS